MKKTVQFVTANSFNSTLFSPSMLSLSSDGGPSPIIDFCTILKQVCGTPRVIGYLVDEGAVDCRHDVALVKDNHVSGGSKTLEKVLQLSHKRASGYYLSRKDRLHLAVVLASSVLQLDGTSWLKKQWRSHDIYFLQTENCSPSEQRIDYEYPYLSTKICPDSSGTPPRIKVHSAVTTHLIRSEILFALGLTLIELCFGQTLVEMQIPEDVNTIEVITNYQTVTRLLDFVYNESGSRYGDVVRRCLQCPFDVRDASLDNDDFQQAVFESIVAPLVQDLEDFNGSSRIR